MIGLSHIESVCINIYIFQLIEIDRYASLAFPHFEGKVEISIIGVFIAKKKNRWV